MFAIPPAVLAVIAAVTAAIPTIIFLITVGAPFLRKWLKENVRKQDLQKLHDSLKGSAAVVAGIAKATTGFTLDDGIAEILKLTADEVGKALVEKYGKEAVHYIAALHADERRPDLMLGTAHPSTVPAIIRLASEKATSPASKR